MDVAKELAERIVARVLEMVAIDESEYQPTKYDLELNIAALITSALQPQWVSVKERLPNPGEHPHVLSHDKYGYAIGSVSEKGVGPGIDITHWTALPAPPTEQNERAEEKTK